MSKEAAAAILVQTLFTSNVSMQNLLTAHAKEGSAKAEDAAAFIQPYYVAVLKAIEGQSPWEERGKRDQSRRS
jgi:hypothetical protein